MEQYHLTSLYSMLRWMRWSSLLLPLCASPDESECPLGEAALQISGIELMKPVLRVRRVEEGRSDVCVCARACDERSDAQPPRRRNETTKNKVVVLTGREELPNEICEELFRLRSSW